MTEPLITWELIRAYQTLIVGIPSFIIIVLVFWQVKHMKDIRNSEMFMRAFEMWESPILISSREAIMKASEGGDANRLHEKIKEYETTDREKYLELIRVGDFFESLGCLEQDGLLDFELLYNYFGAAFCNYYDLYKPWIDEWRKAGEKELFKCFEILASKSKRLLGT